LRVLNSPTVRTQDLIAVFGTQQAIGELFQPPISKSAVSQWGGEVPELRVFQLRKRFPDIDERIAKARRQKKAA